MRLWEWHGMSVCVIALAVTTVWARLKSDICSQPHAVDGYLEPVVWRCNGQLPLWSYSRERDECLQFRYGGCGGNANSFYTKEDCEFMCKD